MTSGVIEIDEWRLVETHREQDGEVRWCFQCRKPRRFDRVVFTPTDPVSYYGPSGSIRCGACHFPDGDLFPGRCREWE